MFSTITIASSTTNPVAMVSAISVRLLIEKPARYITPNVPISDSGTTTLGMIVAGMLRRNTKVTSTTSATANISSCCTSLTEARIVSVRSLRTATDSVDGRLAVSCRQQRVDAIDDVDDVGAGLPLDVHQHGGLIVGPRAEARVLGAVDDLGDVGEPQRRAAAVGDDQVAIRLDRSQLIVGVEHERALGAVEVALRLVDVGGGNHVAQGLQVQVVRRQRLRVGLDAHGRTLPSGEAHEADAGQLRQLLRDARVDQVVDVGQRHGRRRDRQREHRRVGRIDLVVDRRLGQVVGQQVAGRVDRRLHFLLGDLDRLVEREAQRDAPMRRRNWWTTSDPARASGRTAARAVP